MTNEKTLVRCVGAVTWCCGVALASCSGSGRTALTIDTALVDAAFQRLETASPLLPQARLSSSHAALPVSDVEPGPQSSTPDAGDTPERSDAGAPVTDPVPPDEPPPVDAVPDAGAPDDPAPADGDAGVPPSPADPPPTPPPDIVAQAALPLHALEGDRVLSEAELWERLGASPAICFGEYHDRAVDHFGEHRALEQLIGRRAAGPLAVGFEMFQRPFQSFLSAYVEGQLDEAGLIAGTEWVTRWGYDFALYRPLLESARRAHLPALALNAPRELTRKIGRTGLASLDAVEAAQLPELDLQDAEHRAFIFGLFGVLPEHAAELGLENVYVAQTVWDETMADTSASWLLQSEPGAQLLVLAGNAHCHRSAIPRRITRRTGIEVVSLITALESELSLPGFNASGYDLLVVFEDRASVR